MLVVPIIFMFAATLTALIIETKNYFVAAQTNGGVGNYIMTVLPIVLFILAIILAVLGIKTLSSKDDRITSRRLKC